jgi:hypothetical protein
MENSLKFGNGVKLKKKFPENSLKFGNGGKLF